MPTKAAHLSFLKCSTQTATGAGSRAAAASQCIFIHCLQKKLSSYWQSLLQPFGVMPKVYLLKKLNTDDPIWKHYPEDDFVRWVGENEEEARRNAAKGSLPRNKAMSMSPWLNKEQTSCELEYHSEEDGVSGVSG